MRVLAREKDMLEREKWDLRRQTKEATEHASALRSALDLKENRIKELEAELTMVRYTSFRKNRIPHIRISCFLSAEWVYKYLKCVFIWFLQTICQLAQKL